MFRGAIPSPSPPERLMQYTSERTPPQDACPFVATSPRTPEEVCRPPPISPRAPQRPRAMTRRDTLAGLQRGAIPSPSPPERLTQYTSERTPPQDACPFVATSPRTPEEVCRPPPISPRAPQRPRAMTRRDTLAGLQRGAIPSPSPPERLTQYTSERTPPQAACPFAATSPRTPEEVCRPPPISPQAPQRPQARARLDPLTGILQEANLPTSPPLTSQRTPDIMASPRTPQNRLQIPLLRTTTGPQYVSTPRRAYNFQVTITSPTSPIQQIQGDHIIGNDEVNAVSDIIINVSNRTGEDLNGRSVTVNTRNSRISPGKYKLYKSIRV